MFDAQQACSARCKWGEAGVHWCAPRSDIVVVVDVLSFSTAVDIAVERGTVVYRSRWRDDRADRLASKVNAAPAGLRCGPGHDRPSSLTPALLLAIPAAIRLALPSPNGATLSQLVVAHCPVVLEGSLRSATAVGSAVRDLGKVCISHGGGGADAEPAHHVPDAQVATPKHPAGNDCRTGMFRGTVGLRDACRPVAPFRTLRVR